MLLISNLLNYYNCQSEIKIDPAEPFGRELRVERLVVDQMFWTLNIGIWNLPFDSFDLEALDRLAQGGVLVEPFVICLPAIFLAGCLEFGISEVEGFEHV